MTKKDKKYYLNLPWEFEFEKCPEGGYYARVKGIKCYSHGDDLEHAARQIKEALETYIEGCLEEGIAIDEPFGEASGKLNIRTKKTVHLKLLKISKEEGVSVSHLINDAIVRMYG